MLSLLFGSSRAKFPTRIKQNDNARQEPDGGEEGAEFDEMVLGEPDFPSEDNVCGTPKVSHFIFEETSSKGEDTGDGVKDRRERSERRDEGKK